MNERLDGLAREFSLAAPANEALRLAFGLACARRVAHLLERAEVVACLDGLGEHLAGTLDRARFDVLVDRAAELANRHPGSPSIDGCGHAAVSATYAVAKALAGRAVDAASYAAYATVYAEGGSRAVADRDAFAVEFGWQADTLLAMARGA